MFSRAAAVYGLAFMALASGLAGCRKDRIPPRWDVDLLAPLVQTSLTIGDLVPDSILFTDPAGNVSILYTSELFSLSLDTVLSAPDTSFQYAYALPFPGPFLLQPGTTFNTSNEVTQFELEDLQLSKLIVRSGQLDMVITNMMNGPITGDFSLPGATLGGIPFHMQLQATPGTPGAPSTTNASRLLDGYEFDLRGPGFNQVNALATHLSYSIAPGGGAVSISGQDSLLALVAYHDIIPQYATGSFGTHAMEVEPASTNLDLFANLSGTLDLDQVNARLKITNGIGVDARANIHYLRSENSTTGQSVDLLSTITTGPVNIDRALDLGHTFQTAQNVFDLNNGNSNIDLFLENLPDGIGYAMDITINPLGDISNGHDFLYYDSRLIAELEVDIPLRLIATDLTLRQAMEVDLPGTEAGHALQSGTLHLFAQNGFPFSAMVELAVSTADGQVLSLLAPGGAVASGNLGPDGFVASSTSSRLDFQVNSEQMSLLHQTGNLLVTARFNTADQLQHVQLLDSYRLDLQLTLEANYLVNGDE
ncbi:MAG: hypothetical protein KBH07_02400 [Flavobacteriales bacterium]|nr:hypothetical protein [Flavobacteriales bacterium]